VIREEPAGRNGQWNLPTDAYYMSGEGGKVFIVPSLDLVIVRMGHERGQQIGLQQLSIALQELSAIFAANAPLP